MFVPLIELDSPFDAVNCIVTDKQYIFIMFFLIYFPGQRVLMFKNAFINRLTIDFLFQFSVD